MALLVPEFGGTGFTSTLGSEGLFGIVGPIPTGRWLDLLYVDLFGAAGSAIRVGFTLGSSPEPGQEAYIRGLPLVVRSTSTLFGIPTLDFAYDIEDSRAIVLAVGRRVTTGPAFVHYVMDQASAVFAAITVSLRVVGLAVESRERLGQFEDVRLP